MIFALQFDKTPVIVLKIKELYIPHPLYHMNYDISLPFSLGSANIMQPVVAAV